MGLLIANILGQATFVAALAYIFSVWGAKHPNSLTPLAGIRLRLFAQILVVAIVVVCIQRFAQEIVPTDIWSVVSLLASVAVGRTLRNRLIDAKFRDASSTAS